MKPCETCKYFDINADGCCLIEAYVEDDMPCENYHTSKSLDRLEDVIDYALTIATEICETTEKCDSSCNCCIDDKDGKKECLQETLWHIISSLKQKGLPKIFKNKDYNRANYTKGM